MTRNMLVLLLLPCVAPTALAEDSTRQRIEADIRFLASDLLEGRGTPSRGLDLATLYIAESLRASGWSPGMGDSFLQAYDVREFVPAEATVTVNLNGMELADDEFMLNAWGTAPYHTPMARPLVFAGHGVVDVTEGMNPYEAIDLDGTAVVTILGAPWELDPQAPFGYDRAIGKSIEVTIRNADLLVYVTEEIVSTDDEPSAEVTLIEEMVKVPRTYLADSSIGPTMGLGSILAITPGAFDRTLADSVGATYEELRASGNNGPARRLDASIELTIDSDAPTGRAHNVVGLLRGTDPELANEWIVLTAHFDHLGVNPEAGEGEDNIWNGADDNASGTAALLEIARRLSADPPLRSVMMLFVSGEERGILGSSFYSHNPVIDYEQLVIDVNVDMVGRSTGSVQGLVAGSPELYAKARSLGEEIGIEVLPDQQPTWRLAYLTDSYNFDRFDVPSIHFFTGLHSDYHQPTDEPDAIRFKELGQIMEIMYSLTRHYADGAAKPSFTRPEWFLTPQ